VAPVHRHEPAALPHVLSGNDLLTFHSGSKNNVQI
jgi:hypothetical protein